MTDNPRGVTTEEKMYKAIHEDDHSIRAQENFISLTNQINEKLWISNVKELFTIAAIRDIFTSTSEEPTFQAKKGAVAFTELEHYPVMIAKQPWNKQYKKLKTYSGGLNTNILPCIPQAMVIFLLLNFTITDVGCMELMTRPNIDQCYSIAYNLLLCSLECKMVYRIYHLFQRKYSHAQIAAARLKTSGGLSQVVSFLSANDATDLGRISDEMRVISKDLSGEEEWPRREGLVIHQFAPERTFGLRRVFGTDSGYSSSRSSQADYLRDDPLFKSLESAVSEQPEPDDNDGAITLDDHVENVMKSLNINLSALSDIKRNEESLPSRFVVKKDIVAGAVSKLPSDKREHCSSACNVAVSTGIDGSEDCAEDSLQDMNDDASSDKISAQNQPYFNLTPPRYNSTGITNIHNNSLLINGHNVSRPRGSSSSACQSLPSSPDEKTANLTYSPESDCIFGNADRRDIKLKMLDSPCKANWLI